MRFEIITRSSQTSSVCSISLCYTVAHKNKQKDVTGITRLDPVLKAVLFSPSAHVGGPEVEACVKVNNVVNLT